MIKCLFFYYHFLNIHISLNITLTISMFQTLYNNMQSKHSYLGQCASEVGGWGSGCYPKVLNLCFSLFL